MKSDFRHICARHGSKRADARLIGIFLCDDCANLLLEKALNKISPTYENLEIEGFCAFCLEKKKVKQRFYYLCETCERIIRSYGVEKAASSFILAKWQRLVKTVPELGFIVLEQTDPVEPMTYEAHRKAKSDPSRESRPDFIGRHQSTGQIIFAIEMKTGRNAISAMSAFQLDVTDCDDILSFIKRLRCPTYLFHVQVLPDYLPPTERYVGIKAWWASVFDMEKCFRQTRIRYRERRPAAYYDKKCFDTAETFPTHILSEGFKKMEDEIKRRLPVLYVLRNKK